MKKGFTLIELLVVVLIIGILSAVALPQYTKTVEKSRVAEAKIQLKTISDALDRYTLANGKNDMDAFRLSDLDITLPGTYSDNGVAGSIIGKNFEISIDEFAGCQGVHSGHCAVIMATRIGGKYEVRLEGADYQGGNTPNTFTCMSADDTACKKAGAVLVNETWVFQ